MDSALNKIHAVCKCPGLAMLFKDEGQFALHHFCSEWLQMGAMVTFLEENCSVCEGRGDCGCPPFDSKGNRSHYFSALVDCECCRMRVERNTAIR